MSRSSSFVRRIVRAVARRVRAARVRRWPTDGSWRRTPDGLWMFLRPGDFFDVLYAYDVPDAAFRALVTRLVRAGDWALDVGGQKGWNAMLLGRAVGPQGGVLTVEADPRAAAELQANLDRNRAQNVTLVRELAGDHEGAESFALNDVLGWSSMAPNEHQARSVRDVVSVPMRTLDAMVAATVPRGARVSFVKLDIEGAECVALRGAAALLAEHHPALYIEVNPASLAAGGASPAQLEALLAPHGYRVWRTYGEHLGFRRWRVWFGAVTRLAEVRDEMDVIALPPALHAEWAPRLDAASSPERPLR